MLEPHREAQLRQALDEVWLTGSTCIRWDEFYLWTGVQRIAKRPWRVVSKMWDELCDERGAESPLPLTVMSLDFAVVLRREPFQNESPQELEDLT